MTALKLEVPPVISQGSDSSHLSLVPRELLAPLGAVVRSRNHETVDTLI